MVYWTVLIHGLRAIHSVNSSVLVFEDAYLNEVQSCGSAPGLNFGSTTFFCICCIVGKFDNSPNFLPAKLSRYTVYVNDLPTVVRHSQMNMYADDTELHVSGHNLLSVLCNFQCDLDAIRA